MKLRASAKTDTGQVRTVNEDAYACLTDQGLFVVCDGMGGEAAGEVASQLAVETVQRRLSDTESPDDFAPVSENLLPRTNRLASAVRSSNHAIYERAQQDAGCAGMGTTLVGAWIADNIVSLAHVGDSRAYLWRKSRFDPLTRDHSLVEAKVAVGVLSRATSLQSKEQNVLLRVLGRELDVEADLAEVPVQPGDYVLLCSDGLTRMVDDAALAEAVATLRRPQRICDRLVDVANRDGGPDNITVIVVEIVGSWWQQWWNR